VSATPAHRLNTPFGTDAMENQSVDNVTTTAHIPDRPEWLDLKALQRYACVSERTLRDWIHRPVNPLPAYSVGTKILIRRSSFDMWLESHEVKRFDIDTILNDMVGRAKATIK